MHNYKVIKKTRKLLLGGCGCALLLTLLLGAVLIWGMTGLTQWIYGILKSASASLPQEIRLPQQINLPKGLGLPENLKLPQLPNLLMLTPQEQIALGQEVAMKQGLDKQAFTDPQVETVLAQLTKALPEKYSGPKELGGWNWAIRGLKTKDGAVNAIALPGGRIYIYDGLIKMAEGNPDQLAAVIGHEMAHVVEEHSAKQLRTEGVLQKAAALILKSREGKEGSPAEEIVKVLAMQMGTRLTHMQLSQSAEYQADDLGFQFLSRAGFNPTEGMEILKKAGASLRKPANHAQWSVQHSPADGETFAGDSEKYRHVQ